MYTFCRVVLCISAAYDICPSGVCPLVLPSVLLSVTFVYCISKRV